MTWIWILWAAAALVVWLLLMAGRALWREAMGQRAQHDDSRHRGWEDWR